VTTLLEMNKLFELKFYEIKFSDASAIL